MPTFVLLPEEQQTLLASAGKSVQCEPDKSDKFAFIVEMFPPGVVPMVTTFLKPERGPRQLLGSGGMLYPIQVHYVRSASLTCCIPGRFTPNPQRVRAWAFDPDLGVPGCPGSIQEIPPCYQKIVWCRESEQGSCRK